MRWCSRHAAWAMCFLPVPSLAQVSVPYTFSPGTLIQSAQVNSNFQALVTGINTPNGSAYVLNSCCASQQAGGFNLNGPAVLGNIGTTAPDILTVGVGTGGAVVQGITITGSAPDLGLKLYNSATTGRYWFIDTTSGSSSYGAGNLVFVNSTAPAPAMVLTGNGLAGFGTTAPTDIIDVNIGSSGAVNGGITIEGSSSTFGDLGLKIRNTGAGGSTWFIDSTNNRSGYGGGNLAFVNGLGSTPAMELSPGGQLVINRTLNPAEIDLINTPTGGLFREFYDGTNLILLSQNSAGNVGIATFTPDAQLSVNGTVDKPGGGSWGTFSDERLKNIKGRFHRGLSELMQIEPIRYEYKEENALGLHFAGEHVGLGAQSVEKIIPEAVRKNDKGYRILDNDPILWTMVNAIKEQQRIIEHQQNELDEMRAELRSLKDSARPTEP